MLTCPRSSTGDFERILREHDIPVLHVPMIDIIPVVDWTPTDHALEHLGDYDGVLFTSRNGVKYFLQRMQARGCVFDSLPPLHCVGLATEAELRIHGCQATTIPARASAADLAAALVDVHDKVFLHPCSDIAREELHAHINAQGGRVEPIVVYQTVDVQDGDLVQITRGLDEASIGCIAFLSPSAVRRFIRAFPDFSEGSVLIAAIGHTTAHEALNVGLRVDILPEIPTTSALATLIARHFNFNQSGALLTHGD